MILLSSGRAHRWWLLMLATLLVLGVGLAYFIAWRRGLVGLELLGFFSLYLAMPLTIGLLLLFAYLKVPRS